MSKPHTPKQPYLAPFREQMIELVRAGRKPGELAKEFGCHATSILNWIRQADQSTGVVPTQAGALSASERHERRLTCLQNDAIGLLGSRPWRMTLYAASLTFGTTYRLAASGGVLAEIALWARERHSQRCGQCRSTSLASAKNSMTWKHSMRGSLHRLC